MSFPRRELLKPQQCLKFLRIKFLGLEERDKTPGKNKRDFRLEDRRALDSGREKEARLQIDDDEADDSLIEASAALQSAYGGDFFEGNCIVEEVDLSVGDLLV